jgi:hypothetical protein
MMKIEDIPQVLKEIEKAGLTRRVVDYRMKTATLAMDRRGTEYIVFNSNDYLGMTHEKEVLEAARRAISFGTGSGGSRLVSGATFEISDLEKELCKVKHKDGALVFNTGYMANVGVLYALSGPGDVIFSDALNHASIIDGCRMARAKVVVYPHGNMARLEELLAETPCDGERFIVTDGVFSMDGDICPLPDLVRLKRKYHARLLVDDAHALGVIGKNGGGTSDYFQEYDVDLQIGTLSKALGAEGGYVAADPLIIDYLKNRSRPFIFSTALPASIGVAALTALKLLQACPQRFTAKVNENTTYLRNRLKESGVSVKEGETPILPIMVGDEKEGVRLAEACLKRGILLSAIRPPAVPKGTSRLRLTVTAAHTKNELDQVCQVLIEEGNHLWKQ